MKKSQFVGLLPATLMLVLGACSSEDAPGVKGSGFIAPVVEVDQQVITSRSSRAAAQSLTADDLVLTLTSADGSMSESWNGVSAFPTDRQFKVGQYTLTAEYGSADEEGFEKPHYYATTDLKVTENNSTPVSLTATLANTMVSVVYTDAFKGYMADWNAELHASGGEYLYYAKDEDRPVYLRPGATVLNVTFTKPNGKTATVQAASFESQPRHHYTIHVDVNGGEAGDGVMTVTFDDTVDMEPVEIELSDDLLDAPAPVATADGFTSDSPITIIEGQRGNISPRVGIVARGGLAAVTLTTRSKSLLQQGWPEEIDLMNTPVNMQSRLSALGLECAGLWHNPDKMAVVNFTKVLDNIHYLESGDNTTVFTLVVRDRYQKVSEPINLTVDVEKLELTIEVPTSIMLGDDELSLVMNYNGVDPSSSVEFSYKNERGTWSPLTVKELKASARSMQRYDVVLSVPVTESDLVIRAQAGNLYTEPATVHHVEPPFALACNSNDVFATRATLSISGDNETPAQLASKAVMQVSTDNGATYSTIASSANGGKLGVTGLQPATNYLIRAVVDGVKSRPVSFTTEEAAQIPNGNFDAATTNNGSGSNWENVVFQGWGTNNAMTTSQGSDYGYVRISGTKPTDDSKSGKAVCISTQGWGSGNSAMINFNMSKCKYIDAGLLHLGSTRTTRPSGYAEISGPLDTNDLDCGLSFTSRPSSMKFWYKYSPKNSADQGVVKAYVYDAAGNVIASGELALGSQTTYAEREIKFTYADGAPKAAKIYVCFMSTNNATALTKNESWITRPPFASLAREEWYGSRLYIDEVTLNY